MLKLTDNEYETFLKIFMEFSLGEVEEICSFESKTDEQREEVIKVVMKSVEVATSLMTHFVNEDGLNRGFFERCESLVKEDQFQELAALINSNQ